MNVSKVSDTVWISMCLKKLLSMLLGQWSRWLIKYTIDFQQLGKSRHTSQPGFRRSILIFANPLLVPSMSEVNNQNQLDEYEEERANHSNDHPCCNNTPNTDQQCIQYTAWEHSRSAALQPPLLLSEVSCIHSGLLQISSGTDEARFLKTVRTSVSQRTEEVIHLTDLLFQIQRSARCQKYLGIAGGGFMQTECPSCNPINSAK